MKCKGAWKHKLIACITAAALVVTSLTVPTVSAAAEEPDEMAVAVIAADEAAEAGDASDESADSEDAVAPGEETGEEDLVAAEAAGDEEDVAADVIEEEEELAVETDGTWISTGKPLYSDDERTKYTLPKLTVPDSLNYVKNIIISVDSGKVSGEAITEAPNVVKTYEDGGNTKLVIAYSHVLTPREMEEKLRKVKFTIDRSQKKQTIKIRVSDDLHSVTDPMYYNGHYYAFVSTEDASGNGTMTWSQAYDEAKKYRYMGMRGYLVTLTSSEENKELANLTIGEDTNKSSYPFWIGAIRSANFNYDLNSANDYTINIVNSGVAGASDFYWACGPEGGNTIVDDGGWNGGWDGRDLQPKISNGTEACAVSAYNVEHGPATEVWKAVPDGSKNEAKGFVVEFGGYGNDVDGMTKDDGVAVMYASAARMCASSTTGTIAVKTTISAIDVVKAFAPAEPLDTDSSVIDASNAVARATVDEEGNILVTLKEAVTGPVRIPDNWGDVKIDLNGKDIEGEEGNGSTDGRNAIEVVHDPADDGSGTELTIGSYSGGEGKVKGGDAIVGSGKNGGAGIDVSPTAQNITINIDEGAKVSGGDGGSSTGTPGGDGGAGINGDVNSNNGTISGGAGGGSGTHDGGDGGAGVKGTVKANSGEIDGGEGGYSSSQTAGDGGAGVTGALTDNKAGATVKGGDGGETATGTGGNGGNGVTSNVTNNKGVIKAGNGGAATGGTGNGGNGGNGVAGDIAEANQAGGTIAGGNGGDSVSGNGGDGGDGVVGDIGNSNAGKITGGNGGNATDGTGNGGNGGNGIDKGVKTNNGEIKGGSGGDAKGGNGGSGGDGTLGNMNTNSGTTAGGNGGDSAEKNGGTGGAGLRGDISYENSPKGKIIGGDGGDGAVNGGAGGDGLAGNINMNDGIITGGAGGTGDSGNGGAGGSGVDGKVTTVNRANGVITGGNGGDSTDGTGGAGGNGTKNDVAANVGTIKGGKGGNSGTGTGGKGGTGVGQDLTNKNEKTGTITGGNGGDSAEGAGGAGGEGVYRNVATNEGTITGGNGGNGNGDGGAGGDGVGNRLTENTETGTITGGNGGNSKEGTGGAGGDGVNINATTNAGKITGGNGGDGTGTTGVGGAGGDGVGLDVDKNTGEIKGGNGGDSANKNGGDGGNGVRGINQNEKTGEITGGNGGDSNGAGNGGNGGKGASGTVNTNDGTIKGGNGGNTVDGNVGTGGDAIGGGTPGGGSGTDIKGTPGKTAAEAKKDAIKEIEEAEAAAKKKINDHTGLTTEEKTVIITKIEETVKKIKQDIGNAVSVKDIEKVTDNGKKQINKIVSDNTKKSLDDAKTAAKKEIDQLKDLTDDQKTEYKKRIDAAKDADGVQKILDEAKKTMPGGTVGDKPTEPTDPTAGMSAADKELYKTTESLTVVENKITGANTDKGDPEGSSFSKLRLKGIGKKNAVLLKWSKVKKADGYIIYGSPCSTKKKSYKMKKLGEVSKNKTSWTHSKWEKKKLDKGRYYKYMVVAYKKFGEEKRVLAKSRGAHVTTLGGKYTNPKQIILKGGKKAAKMTLKVGKTKTIKATYTPKKKVQKHISIVRFESDKPKIAKVSKNGKVKGLKKGKAKIYVFGQNGVYKTVTVTVKK